MRFCSRARLESILLRVHLALISPPGTHEIFTKSISEWPDKVLEAPQSVQQLALPGTLWEWGWKSETPFPTGRLQCIQQPLIQEMLPCSQPHNPIKWTPLAPSINSCAKYHSITSNLLSSFLQHCTVFWISTESSWGPWKPFFLAQCNQSCGCCSWVWLSVMRTVLPIHREWKTQSKDAHRAWFS